MPTGYLIWSDGLPELVAESRPGTDGNCSDQRMNEARDIPAPFRFGNGTSGDRRLAVPSRSRTANLAEVKTY
jgi:hypothetical protein